MAGAVSWTRNRPPGPFEPSEVLLQMRLGREEALGALRFTVCRRTTIEVEDTSMVQTLAKETRYSADYFVQFFQKSVA